GLQDYSGGAFETDLPRIELNVDPPCDRQTGEHCVNPPPGANFYPIFTTGTNNDQACVWHLGGNSIPGTTNTFGGRSHVEYGPLLKLFYPGAGFQPVFRYNDFRRRLTGNPCQAPPDQSFASVMGALR